MPKTPLAILTLVSFLVSLVIGPMPAYAQDYRLPAPGVMVHLSPPLNPPILKGIKVHPDNPFRFDFILDKGDSELSNDQLKDESSKLIKYFLASLTIPEKDLWVNLSPYEKDRIIPNSFGLTEMGRDLLAEDYMLKQITASLIYPEDEVGKKFWKRIYEEAAKKYGTTDIPINTFNKVWIMPGKAVVYENAPTGTAYVVESNLKVMLEQDYLSLEKHVGVGTAQSKNTNQLGSQIVREIVIPELTKEVNENKNFARLRQVYNSLILATWYKRKIKDSILSQVYSDKNKVAGVNIDDPQEKEKIYQRYLKAFKKGVYNYIKEEEDPISQQVIPKKYFSGGMNLDFSMASSLTIQSVSDGAMLTTLKNKALQIIGAIFKVSSPKQEDAVEGNDSQRIFKISGIFHKPQVPVVSFESIPLPQDTTYLNLISFLQAQKRLKSLSRDELATLLFSLGILNAGESIGAEDLDSYYSRVYQYLAKAGYSEGIISKIKGDTEPDVALDRTVLFQSGSSKIQSVIEAVANSIDALGGSIGQFGMGVKQILAWLEDGERVEVFSKKQGGNPYRLVIARQAGNFQVAIFQSTEEDFRKAMGRISSGQGTVINVIKNKDIPADGEGITLNRIEQSIHRRFAYVSKWLNLWTRVGTSDLKHVNGWEHRTALAGLTNLTHENNPETRNKQNELTIIVSLEPRTLRMIDTGNGMDFQVLSRMFLPVEGGDKENKVMTTPEEIETETQNISLVYDHEGAGSSVVFARNGEVIMRVALDTTMTKSILQGQLMVDLGRLMRVSPARDKIVLQRNQDEEPLKKGFLRLVRLILQNDYSDEEKIKIINTLIGGLEGIAPGNKAVSDIIDAVKIVVKREMKAFVAKLRHEGLIVLPLRDGFDNFQMPEGRTVVFLNEHLFDWRGSEIKQLKEYLGASVLPIVLEAKGQDPDLPVRTMILAVPFRQEVWQQYQVGNFEDIMRVIKSRLLPVVRGDGYVIVPSQIGDSIAALSEDSEKTKEMLELIKILAEEDTANSYEFVLKMSRAFAAFGVKEPSTSVEAAGKQWVAGENFLQWGNEEPLVVAPKPYGPQEVGTKPDFSNPKVVEDFFKNHTFDFYKYAIFEKINPIIDSKKFSNFKISSFPGLPVRDVRDYLDSLGEKGNEANQKNLGGNTGTEDLAMLTLLPGHIRFEMTDEFKLADFIKASEVIFSNDQYVLLKYSKENPVYLFFKKNEQGEETKLFYFHLPFDADEGFIDDKTFILKSKSSLLQFYFDIDKPVSERTLIRLNVNPELDRQWQQKLSTAYNQLFGFIPEDSLEVNRSDYEDAFKFFYGLVRQRIGHVIEGKTSAESQGLAIDALIDDIANSLLKVNNGVKDMWPIFLEENILPLQSHEREDFYRRFLKTLLQAATVEGTSNRGDNKDIIGAMAYGWFLDSPASIESGKAVYRLVEALKARNLKDFPLLSKIVCSIQLTLREKNVSAGNNLIEQINRIVNSEAAGQYLEMIFTAFKGTAWKAIEKAIAKNDFYSLGRLGMLLVFLTSRTDLVAEGTQTEEQDMQWQDIGDGIWLDQLDVWNSANSGVRSVEEIASEHDRIESLNGEAVDRIRQNIRSKIEGLRESGGYAAELMQNFLDAMVLARQSNLDQQGKMVVKYYFDTAKGEFVEEIEDNGPGAPVGKELALLIRKSNKYDLNKEQRGALAGFFGTGKFTVYAGADSVEIVSRGENKVYVFVLKVDRTHGRVKLEKIGWRDRKEGEKTGVMIRRNKNASTIIPALEQMFAESAWKINAGFAVTDKDELELEINHQVRPVSIAGQNALFEEPFYAPNLSSPDASRDVLVNHGVFRIWEHNDPEMPSQIIDKKGLRVEDIALKERFLALVPERIRRIVDKIGIAIQIPLALYESRNGFAQEEEYLPYIQKYVALGIYRALVSKHLSDESFTIDRLISSDFESNVSYNAAFSKKHNSLFVDGRHMFDVVDDINKELDEHGTTTVSNKQLEILRSWFDGEGSDIEKNSIKQFLALLEVDFHNGKGIKERGSVVLRRIKTLMKVSPQLAGALANDTGRSVVDANRMSDAHAKERAGMAKTLKTIDETPIEDWIIPANQEAERQLLQVGREFCEIFGLGQVSLAKRSAPFSGLFSGGQRVLLNQSLADGLSSAGGFSQKVEVIVHELGHLLETAKQSGSKTGTVVTEQHGFNGWTHDDEFSQMMKWASFLILSKLAGTDLAMKSNVQEKIKNNATPGGIDLTPANMNLQTQNSNGEIRFHLDPAQLKQLQNVPGFVPVIINIQPMTDLRQFLGLNVQESAPAAS